MAAVKVSSQSALINYKHAMKFKYFKGSLVISSHNNSYVSYRNISPLSLTESFGPIMSLRNKTQNNTHLVHDLYQPLWSLSCPFWPVVIWCLFRWVYSSFSSLWTVSQVCVPGFYEFPVSDIDSSVVGFYLVCSWAQPFNDVSWYPVLVVYRLFFQS